MNSDMNTHASPPLNDSIAKMVRLGFFAVLTLTFGLGVAGLYQIQNANDRMTKIVRVNNSKTRLIFTMRDAIRLRSNSALRMMSIEDDFAREVELQRYYGIAGMFRTAREQFQALGMSETEQVLMDAIAEAANTAQSLNRKIAELMMHSRSPSVLQPVWDEAVTAQDNILLLLEQAVALQQQYGEQAVVSAELRFEYTIILISSVLVFLMLLGYVIARLVVRHVSAKNNELRSVNEELQRASRHAMEAAKAKTRFLANMSHEIRTPLTSIIGFSETLLEPDTSKEDLRHAAMTIYRSGNHLHQIINDVLDLSKIDAGQIQLEILESSPAEIIADVVAMYSDNAAKKGLRMDTRFEFPLPSSIATDPTRFRQILLNLCSNAIKFTNQGSVCITSKFLPQEGKLCVEVADTGIGMSTEELADIFDPFAQADNSTTRRFGGTGLGLSISKQLAEYLGGTITCRSKPGEGSVFSVTISAGDIPQTELIYEIDVKTKQRLNAADRNGGRKYSGSVLVVEDTEENQMLIATHLRKAGVEFVIAENGRVALEYAAKKKYDLILMDMQMPVMDGLEALTRLRAAGYAHPIVSLTANSLKEDRDRCLHAGADDFLSKPINFTKFYQVLDHYLPECKTPECKAGVSRDSTETYMRSGQTPTDITDDIYQSEEYQQIVKEFLKRLPQMVDSIKQSALARNWEELQSVSHKLKGLGGSFGYDNLTKVSQKINRCAQERAEEFLGELLKELDTEYLRVRQTTEEIPSCKKAV